MGIETLRLRDHSDRVQLHHGALTRSFISHVIHLHISQPLSWHLSIAGFEFSQQKRSSQALFDMARASV